MSLFEHKEFIPGDAAGFGLWRLEHHYEHARLLARARELKSVAIPEYDLLSWDDDEDRIRAWMLAHNDIHADLKDAVGLKGTDLSRVDWQNPLEVSIWLDNHAKEHTILERIFT